MTLLHNPHAGDDDDSADVITAIASAGHEVTAASLEDEDWESALARPADVIAVSGGDGSVREVFKQVAGTNVPVALIPSGSANNIARSLGIDEDDLTQIARWADAPRQAFDLGSFDASAFVESAGGGLFADVLALAAEDDVNTRGEDKVEHGLRLLKRALRAAAERPWRVEIDGRDFSGEWLAVETMNVKLIGPNIELAPSADPGDGLFDVVLVGADDRKPLSSYLDSRLDGAEPETPRFETHRAHTVELAAPSTRLHVDDELLAELPQATSSVVGRLEVLIP